jgi:hypothetical protein
MTKEYTYIQHASVFRQRQEVHNCATMTARHASVTELTIRIEDLAMKNFGHGK